MLPVSRKLPSPVLATEAPEAAAAPLLAATRQELANARSSSRKASCPHHVETSWIHARCGFSAFHSSSAACDTGFPASKGRLHKARPPWKAGRAARRLGQKPRLLHRRISFGAKHLAGHPPSLGA